MGTTVLSALGAANAGSFGLVLKIVVLVASVLVNAAVFVLAFRIATARDLSVRDVAPGALAAAIAWQLLQAFGVVYVRHVVEGAPPPTVTLLSFLALSPSATSPASSSSFASG